MRMDREKLKEYLGIIVDMEKNIYLQDKTIGAYREKIAVLGHPSTFSKPTLQQAKKTTIGSPTASKPRAS